MQLALIEADRFKLIRAYAKTLANAELRSGCNHHWSLIWLSSSCSSKALGLIGSEISKQSVHAFSGYTFSTSARSSGLLELAHLQYSHEIGVQSRPSLALALLSLGWGPAFWEPTVINKSRATNLFGGSQCT